MNYPHIAVRTEGGKLNLEALLSRLRQNSEARRPDETVTQWQRRISYERLTASCREIEDARLTQLLQRKDYLCAEREAAGIPLRRARDKGKHPPPENSIERKAIHYDSIRHEIHDFTGLYPVQSHLPGPVSTLQIEQISASHLAITKALRGFKPELGFKLSTYIKASVKNAVAAAGRPGVLDAMADPARLSYLSQPLGKDDDGGTVTLGDTLTETNEDRERQLPDAAWQQLRQVLPERELDVLLSRHDGASRQAVAARFGLSVEWIRRIEEAAIASAAEALRPMMVRDDCAPVHGGGKSFQAEEWHLESLQIRILKSAGERVTTPRALPFALERLAANCDNRRKPIQTDHLYPASLGKVYPPERVKVTDKNRNALRAASVTVGPLRTSPRMYTYIADDEPSSSRGKTIPRSKLPDPKHPPDRDRAMIEVAPHRCVNARAAVALGLIRPRLVIVSSNRAVAGVRRVAA